MKNDLKKDLDWDDIFKTELYSVCESTRDLIKDNLLKEKKLETLLELAYNFFVIFENSPIPVRRPDEKLNYLPEMVSTSVILPYGCMMVPYFFWEVFNEDSNMKFDDEFSQNVKWIELIGIIHQKWYNKRKKLTKTLVLICKVLSRYGTHGQQFRFPITNEQIANRTRQSLSIIKLSMPDIHTRHLVRDFFLINPWKIGWELYLLSYSYNDNPIFSEYEPLTIAIEICANHKIYRVIQQPMVESDDTRNELLSIIITIGGNLYTIQSTDFHWDLSQLQPQENKSFLKAPYFMADTTTLIEPSLHFEYGEHALEWLQDSKKITNIITHKKNKNKREIRRTVKFQILSDIKRERIIEVLNYLVDYGIPLVNFDTTAEKIGLPVNTFSEILQFLIDVKVIALAHRFKSIGA